MSTRLWLTADEQHLVQVREAAGIDQQELSRRCLLSISQLQELEGKSHGKQFYSEAIKYTAGTRVLIALGAQPLPSPEPLISDEPETHSAAEIQANNTPQESDRSEAVPTLTPHSIGSDTSRKTLPLLKPLALILTAAALIVVGLYGTSGKKIQATPIKTPAQQPVPQPVPVPTEAQPSLIPAPAASAPAVATNITPPAPKTAPAPAPAPAMATPAPTPTTATAPSEFDCTSKFKTSKQVVYQPQTPPSKPGNYVYFVARSATQVCVLDGGGKVLLYNLKPGQNRSHFGTPPFKVWHPDATMVVMYYKGWRVTGQAAQAGVTVLQP